MLGRLAYIRWFSSGAPFLGLGFKDSPERLLRSVWIYAVDACYALYLLCSIVQQLTQLCREGILLHLNRDAT